VPFHRLDSLAEHAVEPRIAGAVPHLPEGLGRARGRDRIGAA